MLPKRGAYGSVDLGPLVVSQREEVLRLPGTFRTVVVDRVALNAGVRVAFPDEPPMTCDLRPGELRAEFLESLVRDPHSKAVSSASPRSPS